MKEFGPVYLSYLNTNAFYCLFSLQTILNRRLFARCPMQIQNLFNLQMQSSLHPRRLFMYQEMVWLYKPQQQTLAFESYDVRTTPSLSCRKLASDLINSSITEFYSVRSERIDEHYRRVLKKCSKIEIGIQILPGNG